MGLALRFIEQMPLDAHKAWSRTEMVEAAGDPRTARGGLHAASRLRHSAGQRAGRDLERARHDGSVRGTVGVIGSVTRPFCSSCDRVRLTSDGQLRNCLFSQGETDLRGPLRSGATDDEIVAFMQQCLAAKRAGHGIDDPTFLQPPRPMSAIGG